MIRPRRRATVPAPATPKSINTPHSFANRPTPPSRSQSAYLPASERRPLKKLRKYYLSNLSSKDGSLATQDQIIRAATYYQSEGTYFIRLSTSGSQGNKPGVLLLESPRPRKGHNVPRLLRTISESSAVKTIGNMVPITPNLGYFTIYRETPDSQINPLSPSITPETITLQTPLPLDNLIVLASKISSRRSRRSLDSPTRTWYIPAIWEGLKRLDTSSESTPLASSKAASDDGVPPAGVLELVDGVMRTFGDSLLLFHHKVLKIQRKSDRSMSASQERKNIVRQEIAERNQDIDQTQANWHAVEQEKEDLRRKESLLRKKLSARNQDAH